MPQSTGDQPESAPPAWCVHAQRIALIYAGFSALWILLSDRAVFHFLPGYRNIEWVNISKGLFFVTVTAVMLWVLLRRVFSGLEHSQSKLREQEHQVRTIYNAVNDGIVIIELETGNILGANLSACRMFKYNPDSIRRLNVAAISSGEGDFTGERAVELMAGAVVGSQASAEWRCRRADGGLFWAEVIGQVTTLDRQPRFLATVRDITGRHHAEQEIRESRARLRALLSRLQEAREAERTRISREVHDVLGQLLTGMKMNLTWLSRRISDPETYPAAELLPKFEETEALADSMLESVQKISQDLRPGILDDLGLPAAIRFESDRFTQRTGIGCHIVSMEETPAISQVRATQVFRVFQELLTNVARHSGACEVTVALEHADKQLRLIVHDDGSGIPDGAVNAAGSLGLMGMSERAALLDGSLDIRRGPEGGTIATLTFPETHP